MAYATMTNDRAIVLLKGAQLALVVALVALIWLSMPSPPSFSDPLPPMWLVVVVGALAWAVDRQIQSALKKRMGEDAFSVWKYKPRWDIMFVALAFMVVVNRERLAETLPAMGVGLAIGLVSFNAVPALAKKRMKADDFAKFNRKYQWAAFAVLGMLYVGYVVYPLLDF